MEFEKAEVRHIELPLVNPFETSFGKFETRNLVVLGVKKGNRWFYGESSAQYAPLYQSETTYSDYEFIKRFLVPILEDVESIEEYDKRVNRFKGNRMGKAAGDFLLHHVDCVEKNISLAELVGSDRHGFADCGASIGLEGTPSEVVDKVDKCLEKGFQRIKLKIKPGKDLDIVREVRKEFPDISLMVDANASYSLEDLKRLKKLDRFNLDMIEQPLSHKDLLNHGKLAERIETPICLDESIKDVEDMKKAAEINACSYVNLKPQRVGGLYESQKIDLICKQNGIGMWIGGLLESGIGLSYCLAASSLDSVCYPGDLAPSKRYFEADILEEDITMNSNGRIELPNKEGLYSRVSRDKLERVTKRKKLF